MINEKLDNLLNLALEASEEERIRSEELNIGYNAADKTWQLIVKTSGSVTELFELYPEIELHTLLNGYAVMTVPQNLIDEISQRPEIEYMEKPKRLFFAVNEGRRVSCVNSLQQPVLRGGGTENLQQPVLRGGGTENLQQPLLQGIGAGILQQSAPPGEDADQSRQPEPENAAAEEPLLGTGILVAIIDSGIDYAHPDFRNADGTTRIVELYDQVSGEIFDSDQINKALAQTTESERYRIVPSRDTSGHGTHVAGICAGNGRASGGVYRGVAPESPILIVKMGNADPDGFPRTTELMLAVDYVLRRARELQMPVAVNISFGNNYGSHAGTSLLETYLSEVSSFWKSVIVTGSGNEGASRIHTSGFLSDGSVAANRETIVFSVGEYEPSLNLQLWKSYEDVFDIYLHDPQGNQIGPLPTTPQTQLYQTAGTKLLVYYGEPRPYSTDQEIYFDFVPSGSYIDAGLWELALLPRKIVTGRYDLWFPGQSVISAGTGFLTPTTAHTITVPATAAKVISVGAYDAVYDSYASFSGRGAAMTDTSRMKPDLAAPGVDVISCAPGGGYTAKSGTSMAAPFVTGAAILLMEWGIRLGNDPYLYGEKVKAYLRRGAKKMPGFSEYPNNRVGYGALCVRDSLPEREIT
ncbi:MAG: S8 family serine peptidase [Clostridiales bacterium]|nr:S8 family serine peptidase [Clostridiales bacterium]